MNREQLAFACERRVWGILINADDEVNGLDPSTVRDRAGARVAWLDSQLAGYAPHELDDAIDTAEQKDRDRAFGQASLQMKATLELIRHELEALA